MDIGEAIRRERRRAGMSQEELAQAIWVSRNTISNWETAATQPDLASLILLGSLFELSIDDLIRGDERAMAQAVARDRNRLLLFGRDAHPGARELAAHEVLKPVPHGVPAYAAPEMISWGGDEAPIYRVRLRFRFMSRAWSDVIDRAGARIGGIARRHGLFAPVFTVRFDGLPRVKIERSLKVGDGVQTVYRVVGGDLALEGNVLGTVFSVLGAGGLLSRVLADRVGSRTVFRMELVEDRDSRLAFGVAVALLLMRDYDRVWARDA